MQIRWLQASKEAVLTSNCTWGKWKKKKVSSRNGLILEMKLKRRTILSANRNNDFSGDGLLIRWWGWNPGVSLVWEWQQDDISEMELTFYKHPADITLTFWCTTFTEKHANRALIKEGAGICLVCALQSRSCCSRECRLDDNCCGHNETNSRARSGSKLL